MDNVITDNKSAKRFELLLDGKLSFVEYNLFNNGIVFAHTEVHKDLEGRGVGGQLAKHVLEYARENRLKVVPVCPFIKAYMIRHPEYDSLV